MYRGLVICVIIHSFYNVDFSPDRPIRSVGPESTAFNINFDNDLCKPKNSRPSTTSGWHMNGIHDDQPPTILMLGRDTHAIPRIGHFRRSLNPHDSISITIHFQEATGLLRGVILIDARNYIIN